MKVYGTVKDAAKEMPIADAKVTLYISEKELAVLYSDIEGGFEHKEAVQYIGETLICKVEKEDFKPQEVTYKIEQEDVPLEIELVTEKEIPEEEVNHLPRKWPKIAIGIAAVIVAAIVVYTLILKSKPPTIIYFEASPTSITSGNEIGLKWKTENARKVSIGEKVRRRPIRQYTVREKGSMTKRPNQTTTYTLTASNKAGEKSKIITVTVRVRRPLTHVPSQPIQPIR